MLSKPASLARFFVSAVVIFLLLVLAWIPVSDWTSYPAGGIARIGLAGGGESWVRSVNNTPGLLQVDTRVVVPVAGRTDLGELVAEVRPAHYAYGLPLYLALLIASRSRRLLLKATAGYLALVLAQAFSVSFDVLKQIMVVAGNTGPQGIAAWRMEAIALGYQFGTLLLPTLAPIALWVGFERRFISAVIVEGFLIRAAKDDDRTLPEGKAEWSVSADPPSSGGSHCVARVLEMGLLDPAFRRAGSAAQDTLRQPVAAATMPRKDPSFIAIRLGVFRQPK